MVEESPHASLESHVSLGGVGRGLTVSFPNPLWEAPLGLSCEHSNRRTGDTPVPFQRSTVIQTACFPAVGLRNLAPKLDWQPELSAVIPSHRRQPSSGRGERPPGQLALPPPPWTSSLQDFCGLSHPVYHTLSRSPQQTHPRSPAPSCRIRGGLRFNVCPWGTPCTVRP